MSQFELIGPRDSLGRLDVCLPAVREKRGQIYSAPEVLEITNRYNENDGVSKREERGQIYSAPKF